MDYLKHIKPGLLPGIYFDLPEEQYFADSSLKRSNIKDLLAGELIFWYNSWLNPNKRPDNTSKEKEYGKLVDCLLFTPHEFDNKYIVNTGFGVSTKKAVPVHEYNDVMSAINALYEVPYTADALTGGYPQVTIIWQDEASGITMAARVDYLKPDIAIDYKTTRSVDKGILRYDIAKYGYDLQSAHYTVGILEARKALREKRDFVIQGVKGKAHHKWLKKFIECDEMYFRFIFQETTFPFLFDPYEMDELLPDALVDRLEAIERYIKMLTKYGTSKPHASNGNLKSFGRFDVSRRRY